MDLARKSDLLSEVISVITSLLTDSKLSQRLIPQSFYDDSNSNRSTPVYPISHHQHHLSAGERSFETGCRPRERTGEGEGQLCSYLKQFMIVVSITSPALTSQYVSTDINPRPPGEFEETVETDFRH